MFSRSAPERSNHPMADAPHPRLSFLEVREEKFWPNLFLWTYAKAFGTRTHVGSSEYISVTRVTRGVAKFPSRCGHFSTDNQGFEVSFGKLNFPVIIDLFRLSYHFIRSPGILPSKPARQGKELQFPRRSAVPDCLICKSIQ